MATTPYRILIVDDDRQTQEIVKATLEKSGFEIASADSAESALRHIKRYGLPHLAIVDLNLNGKINGIGFCQTTKKFSDLPIIILSGNRDTQMIIDSIDLYAEDYVTKPFNPRELVARVRRVIHRIGIFAYDLKQNTHVDNQLSVNFTDKVVTLREKQIRLTPTETKLLYILMRHARNTVSIEFLLERLWPLEDATDDRLRVLIYRLRNKLEPSPSTPYYIVSNHGVGYTFTLPSADSYTLPPLH